MQSLLSHRRRTHIRVFGLRESSKAQAKGIDFKAKHVHVIGAGVMGGDIAAWCALRGITVTLRDLDAARIAPAHQARRRHTRAPARRAPYPRRDGPSAARRDGRWYAKKADVIIEAIFENLGVKQKVLPSWKASAPGRAPRDNTSSIPLEQIATALGPVAARRRALLQSRRANDAGGGHQRRDPRRRTQRHRLCRPDRQAAAACKSAPGFLSTAPYLTEAMRPGRRHRPPRRSTKPRWRSACRWAPVELADVVGLDVSRRRGSGRRRRRSAEERAEEARRETGSKGTRQKRPARAFYVWTNGKP